LVLAVEVFLEDCRAALRSSWWRFSFFMVAR
jgi:hypothetical protein